MPRAVRALLILVAGFGVLIGVFVGVGVLVEEALSPASGNFDVRWTKESTSFVASRGWLRAAVVALTQAGGGAVTIPLAVGAGSFWLVRRRDWWAPLILALSIAGSAAAKEAVKAFVDRPRPPVGRLVETTGSSFPSGHSVRAVALYGALALLVVTVERSALIRRAAWGSAAVLTALVALSRVALGVHYPTDVIAGVVFGAAWLAIVVVAVPRAAAADSRDQ